MVEDAGGRLVFAFKPSWISGQFWKKSTVGYVGGTGSGNRFESDFSSKKKNPKKRHNSWPQNFSRAHNLMTIFAGNEANSDKIDKLTNFYQVIDVDQP